MIISHKHKYIFIKSRKTAGTSIQVALSKFRGKNDIITGSHWDFELNKSIQTQGSGVNMDKFFTNHPHPTANDIKNFMGESWNDYIKFTFVRNPWDLVVSRYHWNMRDNPNDCNILNFQKWVKSGNIFQDDRLSLYYRDSSGNVITDYIGKYETLELDLELITDLLKLPKLQLELLKKTTYKKHDYVDYYDPECKKIVENIFKEDINFFQYEFKKTFHIKNRKLIIDSKLANDTNINGPSVIKSDNNYLLYFANHSGKHIKLAYSDDLKNWVLQNPALHIENTICNGHIASPDVHRINTDTYIMYFHGDVDGKQKTYLATSKNGLDFYRYGRFAIADFYFRMFEYHGITYGIAKDGNDGGILYQGLSKKDNINNINAYVQFQPIMKFLPKMRHCSTMVEDNILYVFYSNVGDSPEHIRLLKIELSDTIETWNIISDEMILKPIHEWEGSHIQPNPSDFGAAQVPVCELRDPYIFKNDEKYYLFYTVMGEAGISMAELEKF